MRLFDRLGGTTILGLATCTFSASVDEYIATESTIAKTNLLANIGPDGSKSQGAKVQFGFMFL